MQTYILHNICHVFQSIAAGPVSRAVLSLLLAAPLSSCLISPVLWLFVVFFHETDSFLRSAAVYRAVGCNFIAGGSPLVGTKQSIFIIDS